MSHIIYLKASQKSRANFNHPLTDAAEFIDIDTLPGLLNRHFAGDKSATDEIVMGHVAHIGSLVARFLYHWSESERFADDLVSEGLLAIQEVVNGFQADQDHRQLGAIIVVKAKKAMEVYLNDSRSTFAPSLTTNFKNIREGELPEYNYAVPLQEDAAAVFDEGPAWVDAMDAHEHMLKSDKEEFVDAVLSALERHEITDLSAGESDLIENLAEAYNG